MTASKTPAPGGDAGASAEPGSGLARLKARMSRASPGYDRTLGIEVTEAERGRVLLTAPSRPDYANPSGVMHGGWIAGLLDAASGAAVESMLRPGENYTTLALQVNYLKAVPADAVVRAEGRIIRAGGRVLTAEARVLAGEDVAAVATATCLRLPAG